MSDTIWWCEEHEAGQPKRDGSSFDDKCYEWWIGEFNPEDPPLGGCRMVEHRRVSPTALVVERNENGEWDFPVVDYLTDARDWPTMRRSLDALAASQGEGET